MFVSPRRSLLLATSVVCLLVLASGCSSLTPPATTARPTRAANVPTDGEFHEAFIPGRTASWVLEQDDLGSTSLVNEQLLVSINSPNTMQFAALDGFTAADFVLEVDAWLRSGPPENSYGVLFRMQDDGQFYRFDITGTGLYIVERRDGDGTWTRLVGDWTPSPAINQGLNVANRLKVIASGPELAFYVNDILLTKVTDNTYASGAVALDAGSFSGGGLEASFDDLTIVTGSQ